MSLSSEYYFISLRNSSEAARITRTTTRKRRREARDER
jgi:hypothetical protein